MDALAAGPSGGLSIIVPVLDEAGIIADNLARLRRQVGPDTEILVVDGGSRDGTPARAAPYAKVLHAAPGRAGQLNAGARAAGGRWLLFLHADTLLPDGFASAPAEAQRLGLRAGVFRLHIAGRHPLLPVLSAGANWRTRWRAIFLGDQAPFVERELFEAAGGFPDQPLLEDLEFALRLKRLGVRLYFSPLRAQTSARRWEEGGFLATWWLMRRIFHRYRRHGAGALASMGYRDVRQGGG